MPSPVANINNRIEAIDALRGLALVGITLRHFLTRFNHEGWIYSENALMCRLDRMLEWTSHHLLYGTVFTIFAFLFGFSFFLLQRKRPPEQFSKYLLIRQLTLLVFACIDASFFPGGDILGQYTVVGIILILLIRLPLRWIVTFSVVLLLQPLEWGRIFFPSVSNFFDHQEILYERLKNQLLFSAENGTTFQNIWVNITTGQMAGLVWTFGTGRLLQTLGLMLLGYYMGRTGILIRVLNKGKNAIRYVFVPVLLCMLIYFLRSKIVGNESSNEKLLQLGLENWFNLGLSVLYVILFLSIYNLAVRFFVPTLNCYGRMSLTNYVIASLFGGILLAPNGFHLSEVLSSTGLFIVSMGVVVSGIWFSGIWLGKRRYGPLEEFWRRMVGLFLSRKNQ